MIEPDQHGTYLLTNVSASNPALLNDVPVAPGESRTLNHGDQICIGGYLLEVRITAQREQGARPETAANLPGGETQDPHAADINAILDKGSTRPLMSDDPLGLASIRSTIRLSDLAGSGKQLLDGLDQESRSGQLAHELTKDPLSESGNPLLEEGALDRWRFLAVRKRLWRTCLVCRAMETQSPAARLLLALSANCIRPFLWIRSVPIGLKWLPRRPGLTLPPWKASEFWGGRTCGGSRKYSPDP